MANQPPPPNLIGIEPERLVDRRHRPASPHSVLLLDEIERAHPDAFRHPVARVMDYRKLPTATAGSSDFRNIVLESLTTNARASDLCQTGNRPLPPRSITAPGERSHEAINRISTTPEFPPLWLRRDDLVATALSVRNHRPGRRQIKLQLEEQLAGPQCHDRAQCRRLRLALGKRLATRCSALVPLAQVVQER